MTSRDRLFSLLRGSCGGLSCVLLVGLVGVCLWVGLVRQDPRYYPIMWLGEKGPIDPGTFVPIGLPDEERTSGDYRIRSYISPKAPLGDGSFEIVKRGQRVYAYIGGMFSIGTVCDEEPDGDPTPLGKDITGRGQPNLVVAEYTGGAHCCHVFHIFEIGNTFRKVVTLNMADAANTCFKDFDGDGRPEIETDDYTFAYWRTCFACSPHPRVVLRFHQDAYQVAADLMRRPAPARADLARIAREIRESDEWHESDDRPGFDDPPEALWSEMLDLIYTGHARLAWEFFDLAWPTARPGKAQFLEDFQSQLAKSPYWPGIRAMNVK